MFRALSCLVAVLTLAWGHAATAQPAATAGSAVIQGRVTDQSTGRPLGNVRVHAASTALPDGRTTYTGPRGEYALTALPAGHYTVTAIKATYLTAAYGQPRPLELTSHAAVVAGSVRDKRGVAARECPLMVFARDEGKWGDVLRYVQRATTDPSGRFEISTLPPGKYYVAAGYGIPWFGWSHDLDLMERIRARAVAVSLRDGQTTVVAVKILGGS
jgi:hypothetical protein